MGGPDCLAVDVNGKGLDEVQACQSSALGLIHGVRRLVATGISQNEAVGSATRSTRWGITWGNQHTPARSSLQGMLTPRTK